MIEEHPDDDYWTPWKKLAEALIRESIGKGFNRYFRAGISMHHFVFSTLKERGIRDEHCVTVVIHHDTNEMRVAYSKGHLDFNAPTIERTLPVESASPIFRQLLKQLWIDTMPDPVPEDIAKFLDSDSLAP